MFTDRVYNAITVEEDLRGIVVQQGGAKVNIVQIVKSDTSLKPNIPDVIS